jgi:hypothetical protein
VVGRGAFARVAPVTLEEDGWKVEERLVVRFLDQDVDAKWFARKHEALAYVSHPFDGRAPYDRAELMAYVLEHFGSDACVIF